MRVLLGCVYAGTQKAYALPKFEEMCGYLPPYVDVLIVTDDPNLKTKLNFISPLQPGMHWATDIVYHGKEALKNVALKQGYDCLIWQGVDCYYNDPYNDVKELIDYIEYGLADIVGALVCGRNRPTYPVCREFKRENGIWLKDQVELPPSFFEHENYKQVFGYIGSDATAISWDALSKVSMRGYIPWHVIKDTKEGLSALGPEEYWMWSAIKREEYYPVCLTDIRPFHFHEDGWGSQYMGDKIRIEDMYA